MSNDLGHGPVAPQGRSNVALIVSLCLNLLLVGLIAMALWRTYMPHPMFGMGPGQGHELGLGQGPLNPHTLIRFAPDEADKIRKIMESHSERIQILRIEAMEARHQAMLSFADPNYTPQNFAKALDNVKSADAALEAEALGVVSESAATLTPAERKLIGERAVQRKGFGMRRRGGF
ncbi:MAG: periplasmic heavy metal sensor [Alphaproteobacteria bacterium]|nr:periplasmic heavy metal sensor [Alphaproteobacteria bacterium]MDE2162414.1 periplasmic heavy metal sensor [Alphaproteobacteria bacterium]MDE2266715.1 periplasmic heavy metal sensor [Alphaproteobacteria bacterium]MDE2501081.1 periplasmic heavy metal sensor [Alphaproteobacteria bacterium]